MAKEKSKNDYVLVLDVTNNGGFYYYEGYYKHLTTEKAPFAIPVNTQEYTKALKIPYKDEAEEVCKKLNEAQKSFSYHVEEHQYF